MLKDSENLAKSNKIGLWGDYTTNQKLDNMSIIVIIVIIVTVIITFLVKRINALTKLKC